MQYHEEHQTRTALKKLGFRSSAGRAQGVEVWISPSGEPFRVPPPDVRDHRGQWMYSETLHRLIMEQARVVLGTLPRSRPLRSMAIIDSSTASA